MAPIEKSNIATEKLTNNFLRTRNLKNFAALNNCISGMQNLGEEDVMKEAIKTLDLKSDVFSNEEAQMKLMSDIITIYEKLQVLAREK